MEIGGVGAGVGVRVAVGADGAAHPFSNSPTLQNGLQVAKHVCRALE